MYVANLQPSVFSFGSAIDGCSSDPVLWDRAIELLHDLPKAGLNRCIIL